MHVHQVLLFSAFLFIAAGIDSSNQQTTSSNCKERPRKLIKSAKLCCDIPTPHIENFTEQCPILGNENATIHCQLECLFNASNALESENLNLAKLHRLLDQVFPGAVDFVAAYYISYEECLTLVKNALKYRQMKRQKCSPTAMLYAACAQMKLLKHCPTKAWNGTDVCLKARNYVSNCADNLLLYKKRKSSLKLNETNQFETLSGNLEHGTLGPKIGEFTVESKNESLSRVDMRNETYF